MAQSPFFTRRLSPFATDADAPTERLAANQNLIRQVDGVLFTRAGTVRRHWQSRRVRPVFHPIVDNAQRWSARCGCCVFPLRIPLAAGP